MYKQHQLPTATGTSLDESKFDLEAACAAWSNFQLFHSLFFGNPQWGPGESADSLVQSGPPSVLQTPSTCVSSQSSTVSPTTPTAPAMAEPTTAAAPTIRPPMANGSEALDDALYQRVQTVDSDSDDGDAFEDEQASSARSYTTSTSTTIRVAARKRPRTDRQAYKVGGVLQELQTMQTGLQQAQMVHEEDMQRRWLDHERKREEEARKLEEELHGSRVEHEEAMEERRLKALHEAQLRDVEVRTKLAQESAAHAQRLQQDNMQFMAAILAQIKNT